METKSSEDGYPDYSEPDYSQEGLFRQTLFWMAFLPVVDGFIISSIFSGTFESLSSSIVIGFVAFSGAAVLCEIFRSKSSNLELLKLILKTYLFVFIGSFFLLCLSSCFRPPDLSNLTAIFLLCLGIQIGFKKCFIDPSSVIKIQLIVILLHCLTTRSFSFNLVFDPKVATNLAAAVTVGFSLSLFGLAMRIQLRKKLDSKSLASLSVGQGLTLILLSIDILYAFIPSTVVFIPLVTCLLFHPIRRGLTILIKER